MKNLSPLFALLLLGLAPGCPSGDPPPEGDADTDTDTDADTDTDTDTDTDVDAYACNDDAQEPNDDIASAIDAGASGTGLVVCAGDNDYEPDFWGPFAVPNGQQITVDVTFTHANGDIDIALYDAAEVELDGSLSTDDDEQIVWLNDSGAETSVYLMVELWYAADGLYQNTYDWNVSIGAPAQ